MEYSRQLQNWGQSYPQQQEILMADAMRDSSTPSATGIGSLGTKHRYFQNHLHSVALAAKLLFFIPEGSRQTVQSQGKRERKQNIGCHLVVERINLLTRDDIQNAVTIQQTCKGGLEFSHSKIGAGSEKYQFATIKTFYFYPHAGEA